MRTVIFLNMHFLLRTFKQTCSSPQDKQLMYISSQQIIKALRYYLMRMRITISLNIHNLLRRFKQSCS